MPDTHYPDTIIVPSDQAPTLLNDDAVHGAVLGSVLGGGRRGSIVSAAISGLIWGMFGKARMQREYLEGRAVQKPSSRGASIAVGAAIGGLAIGALSLLALGAEAMAAVAVIAGIGAAVGGVLGYLDNVSAANSYEAAKAYYAEHGSQYEGRLREAQKARADRITPEEYAELQRRLATLEQHSHANSVEKLPMPRQL